MSVFVRTSKNSGVSVPWIVAPFLALIVMTYWLCWLVVMSFVWGVKFSVLVYRGLYALLARRPRGHA
jgi:hypothetical protein